MTFRMLCALMLLAAPSALAFNGNKLYNGDFEIDQNGDGFPDGWLAYAPVYGEAATPSWCDTVRTNDSFTGSYALKLFANPGGAAHHCHAQSVSQNVIGGAPYRFTGSYKVLLGPVQPWFSLLFYDAAGAYVGDMHFVNGAPQAPGHWLTYQNVFVAPMSAATVLAVVHADDAVGNQGGGVVFDTLSVRDV